MKDGRGTESDVRSTFLNEVRMEGERTLREEDTEISRGGSRVEVSGGPEKEKT